MFALWEDPIDEERARRLRAERRAFRKERGRHQRGLLIAWTIYAVVAAGFLIGTLLIGGSR